MITVQEIVNRVISELDAEGNGYFDFNRDFKPAINSAIEWTVSVITPLIGVKKFPEETFRELTYTNVWQTNRYSGVIFNPADLSNGKDYWTILAIMPLPTVVVLDAPDLIPNLPGIYYTEIAPFFGIETYNAPIVTQIWNAVGTTLLEPQQSTFRPELSHIDSTNMCNRIPIEEWNKRKTNRFSAGFKSRVSTFTQWAYLNASNYTSTFGGYQLAVPREIKISPDISQQLVSIMYITTPGLITAITDTIPYPETMIAPLVQKTMSIISIKENTGSNLYNITNNELLQIMKAM